MTMRTLYSGSLVIVLCALIWAFTVNPAGSNGLDQPVTSEGILAYIPPPDAYICFCGSYLLENLEREQTSYYLLAHQFDLTQFIGKQIVVTGKPILSPCSGTLLQYCDFLILEEIEENTNTPDDQTTWGKIKALYR